MKTKSDHRRYLSPPLLWSLAEEYAEKRWEGKQITAGDLRLYIYATAGGAWLMRGPARIYWQDEPDMSAPFTTAPQDALVGANIEDVTLTHVRLRQSRRWASLEEMILSIRGENMGRPPLYGDGAMREQLNLRLPAALLARIPEPRREWIRDAILRKLDNSETK